MEQIYAHLKELNLKEEQLPNVIQNKINRADILTSQYNDMCDKLDELEDEESDEYKRLDADCENLNSQLDAFEAEIIENINQFVSKVQSSGQNQHQNNTQPQIVQPNADVKKEKKNDGFLWFAGIVAVLTLGSVILKRD